MSGQYTACYFCKVHYVFNKNKFIPLKVFILTEPISHERTATSSTESSKQHA